MVGVESSTVRLPRLCHRILKTSSGSGIQQEAGTLIIQFDGSCHADKEVGGAGAALLELTDSWLNSLRWRALALPKCPDTFLLRQCLQT